MTEDNTVAADGDPTERGNRVLGSESVESRDSEREKWVYKYLSIGRFKYH
jgi:hypothetical protein